MPERLSGSQIDALGKRLRTSGRPDERDGPLLMQLLAEHDAALGSVQEALRSIGLVGHPRLKTSTTLIQKLQRGPVSLRGIHDLAGTRVVKAMTIEDQDKWRDEICALFPGTQPLDRRATPSHGYRAVHIIPKIDGRYVEIQLRTLWQDTWAQMVERLADEVGRQIRYGEPADRPEEPYGRMRGFTRQKAVTKVMRIAPRIPPMEDLEQRLAAGQVPADEIASVEGTLAEFRAPMKEIREFLDVSDPPQ